MPITRSALLLTVTAALLVGAQPAAQADSVSSARACSGFTIDGQKAPVTARSISCDRARPIARQFATDGSLPRGWDSVNPAGCEHVLFHKGDRKYVLSHGYRAPRGAPAINTVRFRGCSS